MSADVSRIGSITDATLREGMQTRAGTFSLAQSVEVARLLATTGVDMIECGHPHVSDEECARVNAVVTAAGETPVLTHARLRHDDIESAAKSGAAWVGIFVGVNALSRTCRTGWQDEDETLARVREGIDFAHGRGLKVRFTVEDASRTSWDLIARVFDVAVAAGAERLCLADSVGIFEPRAVAELFSRARSRWPDVELEGHFHDDRGLALANSLSAIDAGATSISTSVNALGERAGITDLAVLMVNQHLRAGASLPEAGLLDELSRRVGAYSRSAPDARRPVVGSDVFHHSSRLHVRAVQVAPDAYEAIDPVVLGRERSTGQHGVSRELGSLVVAPPVISATELRHHRHGPGDRYVLVDDRFVPAAGQYCIARKIPPGRHPEKSHVDTHVHHCDSLFGFLGDGPGYTGLTVEVWVGDAHQRLESPASVFIPAGEPHTYRAVEGAGTYLNHVLSGSYEDSLLDPINDCLPDEGVLT